MHRYNIETSTFTILGITRYAHKRPKVIRNLSVRFYDLTREYHIRARPSIKICFRPVRSLVNSFELSAGEKTNNASGLKKKIKPIYM